jgi:hypothetical protein
MPAGRRVLERAHQQEVTRVAVAIGEPGVRLDEQRVALVQLDVADAAGQTPPAPRDRPTSRV